MLNEKIQFAEDVQREIDYLPVGEAQVQKIRERWQRDLDNCVIDQKASEAWWREMIDVKTGHLNTIMVDQRTYSEEAVKHQDMKYQYANEVGSSYNWLIAKCEYMQVMHPFNVAPFCLPATFIGSDGVAWVDHSAEYCRDAELAWRQPVSTLDKKRQVASIKRYLMLKRLIERTEMMDCDQGAKFGFIDWLPEVNQNLQIVCRFKVPRSYNDNDLIGGEDTVHAYLDVPKELVENMRKYLKGTERYYQLSYLYTV